MPNTAECFNCGRGIKIPRYSVVFPCPGLPQLCAGYICDECARSVGQEMRLYAVPTATAG